MDDRRRKLEYESDVDKWVRITKAKDVKPTGTDG